MRTVIRYRVARSGGFNLDFVDSRARIDTRVFSRENAIGSHRVWFSR